MTFEDVKRIRQNPTDEDVDIQELHKMIDLAIEKQIPKKPVNVSKFMQGNCPICNGRLVKVNFCQRCGQALDWSDTDG